MARLGLGGAVRFASGISDEELVGLYAEAEIAVVPSLYEGFSLPAIQAMAAGLPLVATTGGALPEVVGRNGHTALLARPGDAADLARAMQRLLDDSGLRTAMAADPGRGPGRRAAMTGARRGGNGCSLPRGDRRAMLTVDFDRLGIGVGTRPRPGLRQGTPRF